MTVRIGDVVTTVPVTLPTFSAQVAGADLDAMVSIEITGGDEKFAAILGSYRRLARKAGPDAVVNVDEVDRLRVTAMGSAMHLHVQRVLGGRLPGSDREHEQAIRSLGFDVAVGGSVMQALATGVVALPAGYPHGYALLQDEAATRAFLSGQPALLAATEAFAREPSGVALPLASLAAETAILPQLNPAPITLAPLPARLLIRGAAGFEYHGRSAGEADADIAAIDDGTLRMTPRVPPASYVMGNLPGPPDDPGEPALVRREVLDETYRRIFAGDRYSLWSVTERQRTTYPAHPDVPASERLVTSIEHAFPLHSISQRFRTADVLGRRVLPYFCLAADRVGPLDVLSACEYAQTTFLGDRTGLVEEIGAKVDDAMEPRTTGFGADAFRWALEARGPLRVEFAEAKVTYWRLEGGDTVVLPLLHLARWTRADGRTETLASTTTLMDARDGGIDDRVGSFVGRWRYGTFEEPRLDRAWVNPRLSTVFERSSDGITIRTSSFQGVFPPNSQRWSWQLVDIGIGGQTSARLFETRFLGDNAQSYASCAEAVADASAECTRYQVRYFRPIAQVGARTYGIDELHTNLDWFGEPGVRVSRPTYHERIESPL